jgi:hypothetical protein
MMKPTGPFPVGMTVTEKGKIGFIIQAGISMASQVIISSPGRLEDPCPKSIIL